MDTIIEQYVKQLDGLFDSSPQSEVFRGQNGPEVADSDHYLTVPNQLLIPTLSWNWPTATIGTISDDQFQFADRMPVSSEPATLYLQSANSFSDNYRTFLDFIDPQSFPSKSLLKEAKEKIKQPDGDPATAPTPPGWTKVNIAGINRWRPIWNVPVNASTWKNDVEAGAIQNPGTILIRLKDGDNTKGTTLEKRFADNHSSLLSDESAHFEQISITAKAWGQIGINPGAWFDSSIFLLGRKYVPDEKSFFGKKGLLSCRVAAFYVAYKPEFNYLASSTDGIGSTALAAFRASSQTNDLYAMGVNVEVANLDSVNKNSTSVKLSSTSPDPAIIAVALEIFVQN